MGSVNFYRPKFLIKTRRDERTLLITTNLRLRQNPTNQKIFEMSKSNLEETQF